MDTPAVLDYKSTFSQAPLGMCITRNGIIETVNEAAVKIFGYVREELIGKSMRTLYPTQKEFERADEHITPILHAKASYSGERIMKRADKALFWAHVTGSPLLSDETHAAEIWIIKDLSDKRPIAAELTPREREIATLLAVGSTSKFIAQQIGLSPRTVEMHRARLIRKFSVARSSELVHVLIGMPLSQQLVSAPQN